MEIYIAKTDGLWIGGAHMYNPRWWDIDDELTCTDAGSDASAANIITRFAGNDTASKVEPAIMLRTQDAITDEAFETYAMANFFDTYGITDDYVPDLSEYANPFCLLEEDNETALWGDDCSSANTTVSSASFSSTGLSTPEALVIREADELPSDFD
ncbi:MAG: hypothetical protein ABIA04_13240 [Pseudomonadota bacterium]